MKKKNSSPIILTERQKFWLGHFRSCEADGNSHRDYARQHGLNINSFRSMGRRLVRLGVIQSQPKKIGPIFKKIPVQSRANNFSEIRLCFPSGVCVELSTHFNEATLPIFLQTVAQLK